MTWDQWQQGGYADRQVKPRKNMFWCGVDHDNNGVYATRYDRNGGKQKFLAIFHHGIAGTTSTNGAMVLNMPIVDHSKCAEEEVFVTSLANDYIAGRIDRDEMNAKKNEHVKENKARMKKGDDKKAGGAKSAKSKATKIPKKEKAEYDGDSDRKEEKDDDDDNGFGDLMSKDKEGDDSDEQGSSDAAPLVTAEDPPKTTAKPKKKICKKSKDLSGPSDSAAPSMVHKGKAATGVKAETDEEEDEDEAEGAAAAAVLKRPAADAEEPEPRKTQK
ncbi:unnamed protein product, partial [Prorocentrum cordatum]